MKLNKIFFIITRNILISVGIVFFIAETVHYFSAMERQKERQARENEMLFDHIQELVYFRDLAFSQIETQQIGRISDLLVLLSNQYLTYTELIALADLELMRRQLAFDPDFEHIYIINAAGNILNTTNPNAKEFNFVLYTPELRDIMLNAIELSIPTNAGMLYLPFDRNFSHFMFLPTIDKKYLIAIASSSKTVNDLNLHVVERLDKLSDRFPFVSSIEMYIQGFDLLPVISNRSVKEQERIFIKSIADTKGKNLSTVSNSNSPINQLYSFVQAYDRTSVQGYIIKVNTDRTAEYANLNQTPLIVLIAGAFIGIIAFVYYSFLFRKYISNPISRINRAVQALAEGSIDSSFKTGYKASTELGELAKGVDGISDMFYKITQFVSAIGKGRWNYEYVPQSERDDVANALVAMRKNMQYLEDEQIKREIQDEKQNWVTRGLAQFSEIIYKNSNNLTELAEVVIKNLVKYLQANQGGFFVMNTDENDEPVLELIAAYAYNRRKFLERKVPLKEGLVGMCALEKATIHKTDLPKGYFAITSGLGKATPNALLLIPLKSGDEVFGVIEIATFDEFNPFQIEFAEKIGESLGINLSNLKAKANMEKLLTQFREQTSLFEEEKQQLLLQMDKVKKIEKKV